MKNENKTKEQFLSELKELRQRIAELEKSESECKRAEEALHEAEAKYRSIFENAVEGIFLIALDGRILAANPAAARMMGYDSPEEFITVVTDIRQIYLDPDHRDELIHLVQTKGVVIGFEVQTRRKDGSVIWTSANVRALRDENGSVVGFVGMGVDITERKRIEEALRKERDKAQKYLDIAGVMIVVIDADQKVTLVNKKCSEILGYEDQEIIGKNWFDTFIPERIRDKVKSGFTKLIAGEIESFEFFKNPVLTRSGEERIIAWHNAVLRDEAGNITGTLSSGEDITESKQAEEMLQKYTVKLEESNSLKDLFTDIMSHDLLNPLGVIKIATEQVMLMEPGGEVAHDMLLMIKRNVDKLINMIKSASMYAMLESAEKLERSNLDLNEIFKATVNNLKPQLEEKNMTLEYFSKGECSLKANLTIESVFSNLLSNAIKYSPSGRKIEVNIMDENERCKIYVRDWGYGIKDEDKAKIFTRFQRVDKKGVKGTGLGLAIVKRIVDLHGGRVWIEDNPEGGSVFCVDIPKV